MSAGRIGFGRVKLRHWVKLATLVKSGVGGLVGLRSGGWGGGWHLVKRIESFARIHHRHTGVAQLRDKVPFVLALPSFRLRDERLPPAAHRHVNAARRNGSFNCTHRGSALT